MPIQDKDGNALSPNQIFEKIIIRIKTIWLEFVTGFLWWSVGNNPFHSIRRFFYKLAGMKIGKKATIHMRARIYYPQGISIGEGSLIGEKASLDGRQQLKNSKGGLEIGKHVDIASEVVIGDYVFIGPRAIIMPGVKIAKGAIVAAGAIVTKDVGENEIVAGIPAKKIADRKNKNLNYKLGRPRLFQ
jgi:maltose O-acetyltransferase